MSPEVAYVLLGLMAILVMYFAYRSYQDYQKSPTRWALREMAVEWGSRLFR